MKNLTQCKNKATENIDRIKSAKSLQKVLFIILFLTMLLVGMSLRFHNLTNVFTRSPDEKIYTYQARTIAEQGTEGIKLLVEEYNMNKVLWIYPIPLRVGYLRLLATVMKVTNSMDVKVGACISCFFSIISLLFLIVLGLRFFNQWITLYALLFMSVSPMDLAIARRTWQEAMLGCLGLLLIYFCCEITRATHKIIWYILFIIVGSYCILIKSSGAVIYMLCIAWLLWILFIKERSLLKGVVLIVLCALGVGISIAFLVNVTGGISNIIEALMHMKEAIPTNRYANQYCSGPWYQFFGLLWIVSPVNTILCFVGITETFLTNKTYQKVTTLPVDKSRSAIFGIIFFMIALMVIIFLAKPHPQNLRYVSVLYVPFYLLSGLGFWYIVSFTKKILKKFYSSIVIVGLIAVIMFAAVNDYQNFKKIIVKTRIEDLSIGLLRQSSH